MPSELLYQIALTLVNQVGAVHAKLLLDKFGSASEIFHARFKDLDAMEGIGSVRAKAIKDFNNFSRAEEEIRFIEKFNITPLFLSDPQYPRRLLNCYDPPTLLYLKGAADLNCSKVISIVGTRNCTHYGKSITEKLIADLAGHEILIISGLAFGIDTIAHKAALTSGLPTIGVVGHGLDAIYPIENKNLAKEMVTNGGGLLTQFTSQTNPDKHNFPIRNRIVAGLADATIIVETNIRGGSMITAELANGYNRDVFAIPGRVTDKESAGTNFLVANNKAVLLTSANQLLDMMGWEEKTKSTPRKQRELFINLSNEEKIIFDILQQKESVHIDEINVKSGISTSSVAAAILSLELQNIIRSIPGKMYALHD